MAPNLSTVMEEEINQMNEKATPANTNPPVWLILKQLSPSVLVRSDLNIYLTAMRFSKYQSLVTYILGDSC